MMELSSFVSILRSFTSVEVSRTFANHSASPAPTSPAAPSAIQTGLALAGASGATDQSTSETSLARSLMTLSQPANPSISAASGADMRTALATFISMRSQGGSAPAQAGGSQGPNGATANPATSGANQNASGGNQAAGGASGAATASASPPRGSAAGNPLMAGNVGQAAATQMSAFGTPGSGAQLGSTAASAPPSALVGNARTQNAAGQASSSANQTAGSTMQAQASPQGAAATVGPAGAQTNAQSAAQSAAQNAAMTNVENRLGGILSAASLSPTTQALIPTELGAARSVAIPDFANAAATMMAGDAASRSMANGVILNAAMLPGWPYPSAFAKDGLSTKDAQTARQFFAALNDGKPMTDEEMAKYIASLGFGIGFMNKLRKLTKELDKVDRKSLFAFLASLIKSVEDIAHAMLEAVEQDEDEQAMTADIEIGSEQQSHFGEKPRRRLNI